MSSWVGPSPPQTMTPSDRASAVRSASTMRRWLSPTCWWKWLATPARRELLAEPLRVRVGDLSEQQLGADRDDLDPHAARERGVRPSRQYS